VSSRILKRTIQTITHKLAQSHIAGPHVADALGVCKMLDANNIKTTICSWEQPADEPLSVIQHYERTIDGIIRERLDCVLSIKAPSFRFDFELLRDVLEMAKSGNVFIRFDAQSPDAAAMTFVLLEKAAAVYPRVGCTLPARWKRSASDAERVGESKFSVRIVKGQWPDPLYPRLDVKASFFSLARILAEEGVPVTIATHNISIAAQALAELKDRDNQCELEQMFGLPWNAVNVARAYNVPFRIYVPYGFPQLPYNLSDIKSRPAVIHWALRDLVLGRNGKQLFTHLDDGKLPSSHGERHHILKNVENFAR
jgi:proline dehydrogenase